MIVGLIHGDCTQSNMQHAKYKFGAIVLEKIVGTALASKLV